MLFTRKRNNSQKGHFIRLGNVPSSLGKHFATLGRHFRAFGRVCRVLARHFVVLGKHLRAFGDDFVAFGSDFLGLGNVFLRLGNVFLKGCIVTFKDQERRAKGLAKHLHCRSTMRNNHAPWQTKQKRNLGPDHFIRVPNFTSPIFTLLFSASASDGSQAF
jgi:hypothetical protein